MHHGVRNFDSRWKAVEDQPAYLAFQNRDQIAELAKICFGAMNGCGQVASQIARELQHLSTSRVANYKGRGAENFCRQIRILQERFAIGFEERRAYAEPLISMCGRLSLGELSLIHI